MMGQSSAVDPAAPSPVELGTFADDALPPPIAFDPAAAPAPRAQRTLLEPILELMPPATEWIAGEAVAGDGSLQTVMKAIRPICVGALMAIPTLGPATVGAVAAFDRERALAMVAASTAFLAGIPGDIVFLIGALATGYGVARTIEKTKRAEP